jgi:hypothetical protein
MYEKNNRRFITLTAIIAVAVSGSAVGLVGCPGPEVGSRDQITVVTQRWVIDDDVVRVVGLARNTGDLPTPESEVVATLRSRTGSFQGQNRAEVPALDPGSQERFAVAVDSHGRVETVEITFVEPGTVTDEGGAPANSAGDDSGPVSEESDEDDA